MREGKAQCKAALQRVRPLSLCGLGLCRSWGLGFRPKGSCGRQGAVQGGRDLCPTHFGGLYGINGIIL